MTDNVASLAKVGDHRGLTKWTDLDKRWKLICNDLEIANCEKIDYEKPVVLSVAKSNIEIMNESKGHKTDVDPLHDDSAGKENLLVTDTMTQVEDEKSQTKNTNLVSQFSGVDGCTLSPITTDNSMYPIIRDKALSIGKLLAMSGSSNSVPHRVRNWFTFDKEQINFEMLRKHGLKYETKGNWVRMLLTAYVDSGAVIPLGN